MRKLLILLTLTLLLVACSADAGDYLEYTRSSFCASIEGSFGGVEFAAELKVGQMKNAEQSGTTGAYGANGGTNSTAERDLEITFLAPASMAGVKITRREGKITISSGEIDINATGIGGWISLGELLIPDGRISDSGIIPEGDSNIAVVELQCGGDTVNVYIDCESGHPVRVRSEGEGGEAEIRVNGFSYIK